MIEDALGQGRMLGMVQPDPARGPTPAGPASITSAASGGISSFSETDDGRFLITLTGVTAVQVFGRAGNRGAATAGSGRTSPASPPTSSREAQAVEREALLEALRAYFRARGFDANWDAINEMPDPVLVATLAMVCPFEPPEKQALLEAPDTAERAQALLALLQMGAHRGRRARPIAS